MNKSWNIHDFFQPVSNNASSSSPFNAAVTGYFDFLIFWYFDIFLIAALAFHKDNISSIWISTCTYAFFSSYFFNVSKSKKDVSEKIFIEYQMTSKTNQLMDL